MSVYAGTSRESVREVVRLILEELRRMKQERIPDEELRRAKDAVRTRLLAIAPPDDYSDERLNALLRASCATSRV